MKQQEIQVQGEKEIVRALDPFFRLELKQHKKDGTTAIAAFQKSFEEVKKLTEWGKLVLLPAHYFGLKAKKHSYHVAAAFQFLVLCVLFQQKTSVREYAGSQLGTDHFPKKKQKHAEASVNLVLGDLSLALMYNILLEMPASADTILHYEGLLADVAKDVFSNSVVHIKKSRKNIYSDLFLKGLELGVEVSDIPHSKGNQIFTKAKHFWKDNKKESTFADSFLNILQTN